jgi:hypothetical protein
MESKYFIVSSKQKKSDIEQAGALLYELNNGALLLSAVPAGDSVHYVIGVMPQAPELSQEDAEIIRDNLAITHPEKNGE